MRLIDTHCHLAHERLRGDLPAVLLRARQAGVTACICASGNVEESAAGREMSNQPPICTAPPAGAGQPALRMYFLAGVHPHEAKNAGGDYLGRIEELAADARNAGIGEIGLDYHYNFSPPEVQRAVFAAQLDLAARLRKKVVIHTREAFEDTMAILKASPVEGANVVFHSFTGEAASAKRVLDMAAMISFSGIATFTNAGLIRESAAMTPVGRIMIETDSPYLSPHPVRKMKTNEPANVVHVANCLAAVRKVSPHEFGEQTTENAIRFFGLVD